MSGYRVLSLQMTEEDAKKIIVHKYSAARIMESEPRKTTWSLENVPESVARAIVQFNTPPLEEPKEFGAMVEAGVSGWGNRVPLVNVNGRWWSRNNIFWDWSDLVEPKRIENPK
jgi:hypothetical protein